MAKILLLDYEKEDYELLQERNYDVEFAETNWKSLTTDILIVPKNCRIVFYQLNSENPASGLHSEDTEKFQKIIDKGGTIICFIGRCKQFQLTNFTGEYPNLDMQNYDIPNPIESIQESPFDQIFKDYGQFISYANTLFNVVLPVGETISMAAWDPNLDEKLTVLASGSNGLPLSVKIQRGNGFFLFLPWFGDHNNTITEMLLDHVLPEISPNLFEEEAAPPEEPLSETSEAESLPDLSGELEPAEIEDTEIESSEMKPPEDEFPEFEETEAPSAEVESTETEVQEKEPEDLQEPEAEESWEEPEIDSVPETPEEPPEAVEEEGPELDKEKSEDFEPSEEKIPQEDQIEIEEDKLSEDIEIPETEEEPSPEEEPEKTLEEELEIEDELELEEEIPSWEEEAEAKGKEKEIEAEEEPEQPTPSNDEEFISELEEETPPPDKKTEETKAGDEEQETEEVSEEQEPAQAEESEEELEISEAPAEEAEAEVQPEVEAEPEITDESGFEQKSIPDTVLLEVEEKPPEAEEVEPPSEMEEISPPVEPESAVEKGDQVSWMEQDEYLFPSIKEISEKIEEERIKYEEKIQKLTDSMKEIKEKEQIVFTKLLTAEGEELKQAVISTLEYLGGKKVIDVRELWKDEERGPEEDIWLLKDDKKPVEDKIKKDSVILVTVKSDDEAAKDDECSSIQKYKGRRMQEFHNTDMKAILIGNYYRQEEPKLRKDPFSEDQIAEAKIDQNALLTTFELFKAIQAEKTKNISKSEIIKQLETKMGLISFDY